MTKILNRTLCDGTDDIVGAIFVHYCSRCVTTDRILWWYSGMFLNLISPATLVVMWCHMKATLFTCLCPLCSANRAEWRGPTWAMSTGSVKTSLQCKHRTSVAFAWHQYQSGSELRFRAKGSQSDWYYLQSWEESVGTVSYTNVQFVTPSPSFNVYSVVCQSTTTLNDGEGEGFYRCLFTMKHKKYWFYGHET